LLLFELKSFMIRMVNELSSHQLMPPMLQSSHNGIKLFVICRILPLGIIELFTKEGYGPLLLRWDSPYPHTGSITLHFK